MTPLLLLLLVKSSMAMKHFGKLSHKSLAGFLMIWLSGVVFLLCCAEMSGKTADKEFCPLEKMSAHCDRAENKDSQVVTNQTDEQGVDCCAFLPVFFDKTRTIETSQPASTAAPATVVEKPSPILPQANFVPTISYRSTILLRNNTFLKNRTFRI
jgi:hypothetical protein